MTEYQQAIEATGLAYTAHDWEDRPSYNGMQLYSDTGKVIDRWEFCREFSFAIPDKHALDIVAGLSPILEVGAGTGYWAYELRKRQVDIVATDPGPLPPHKNAPYGFKKTWTTIEQMNAIQAIKKHPTRTLFMCWPTYDTEWARDALRFYKGKKLVYVGEDSGGCCATDGFFSLLEDWTAKDYSIPQWYGLRDYLTVYER